MRPAVFLDRDGVLIQNRPDYVKSWSDVEFLFDSLDAMRQLAASSYLVVIVTNQSVVGRGMITLARAQSINQQVIAEVIARGGRVDASYLCPHTPEDGCPCRKPAPGMLLQATKDLGLDLRRSFMVGDALTDIEAGRAVGVRGLLVRTGRGARQAALGGGSLDASDLKVANLSEAVTQILKPGGGGR